MTTPPVISAATDPYGNPITDGSNASHAAGATTNAAFAGSSHTWDYVAFDLGGQHALQEMWVWNFNQDSTRGLQDVSLWYSTNSTDGLNGDWTELAGTTGSLGYGHQLAQAPSNASTAVTSVIDFGGVSATWVKILDDSESGGTGVGHDTNNTNGGIGTWGAGQTGLSEVAFFESSENFRGLYDEARLTYATTSNNAIGRLHPDQFLRVSNQYQSDVLSSTFADSERLRSLGQVVQDSGSQFGR